MDEPRKIRVDQQPQFSEAGTIRQVYRVTFMVGEDGPFHLEFLPADFTDTNVRAGMQAVAETLRKL